MYRKLVINVTEYETRVALLEDGTIVELFIERGDGADIAGNVYKGRVQRVLPGMQAAFVDIGIDQAAFIYVDDVIGNSYKDIEELFIQSDEVDKGIEQTDKADSVYSDSTGSFPIEALINEGQEIMVQVAKSPIGTKGARVTSHVSLPGHILVMMPTSTHIGISKRIENESERNRLKKLLEGLRTNNFGYIARTAAEGIEAKKIEIEIAFLMKLWETVQKKFKTAPAPSLLHQELNIIHRAVRDLLIHDAENLIIDSRSEYESVLRFLDMVMPSLKHSVELYEGTEPIFDAHNLEGDISRGLKRKVWLKSGGYIVIEHTEALTAIDVNTGRYVGKRNPEETILTTNLEAVKEITYQIRLRDIGGIIVVDFIDMEKISSQEKVFNAFQEALQKDRSKTHVLPISEMGLIQMTRKRTRKPLTHLLCEPCFYCEGEGYLLSKESVCYNIYKEILHEASGSLGPRLTLRVNSEIADLLHGGENRIITSLERIIGKQIEIYPNAQFHLEKFDIFERP